MGRRGFSANSNRAIDATATKHAIGTIKYGGLAPRDSADRLVERHLYRAIRCRFDVCCDRLMPISHSDVCSQRERNTLGQGDITQDRLAREQLGFITEVNHRRVRIDANDVRGLTDGDPHAFALADGESVYPIMSSYGRTARVDNRSRARRDTRSNKIGVGVSPTPDEAELLALALLGSRQSSRDRFGANIDLGRFAQGEHEAIEPVSRGRIEEVALVLGVVYPRRKIGWASGIFHDPGVMPSCDPWSPESVGKADELRHLYSTVAYRTGAGGLSRHVSIHKGRDDCTCKQLSPVKRVVRKAQGVGYAPSVVLILGCAASVVRPASCRIIGVVPQVKSDSDYVISASTSRAAATDESTPPLIAMMIRSRVVNVPSEECGQ